MRCPDLKNDPIFNVPRHTPTYEYILNPNPQLVNARTKIYSSSRLPGILADPGMAAWRR
jgi:hypothetical protein